jgi:imidazolonepropionase-like amidohydrolase
VGSVAPGAFADIVATRDDPRKDVKALEHPVVVLQGGAVVRDDRRQRY